MINESLYPVPWLPAPPEHDQVRAWGLCWPISWFLATSDGGRTAPNPGATSQVYTAIASRRHWRCRAWIIINKMLKHVWRVFFKSLRDFVDKVNKIYRWRCWSEHVCCCDTGKKITKKSIWVIFEIFCAILLSCESWWQTYKSTQIAGPVRLMHQVLIWENLSKEIFNPWWN